ncbi:tripartite tricarboxylate transporter TctB family protein [Chloroflexota bacterium]
MRVNTVLTIIFLAFAMILIVVGLQYPFEVRAGPLLASVIALVLLVTELLKDFIRRERRETKGEENPIETKSAGVRGSARVYLRASTWILGLVIGTYLVGLVITFPLFTLAYLKTHRERWFLSIGVSLAILVLIYGIFGMVLRVPLYKGILLG